MPYRLFFSHMFLRLAIGFWIALAVAVCIKTAKLEGQHSVYPVFAAAANHWWADQSLYADYVGTQHIDGYRYSPAFAVAFTPFTVLPGHTGEMVWDVASLMLLFFAMRALVRNVLPGDWPPWRESLFLILTLAGSAVGVWSSQSNAMMLALVAFGLSAIVRQRWWAAAALLAVPVFIKLWPMVIVLLLLMCWPRQLSFRLAVVFAVLLLVPFVTRPPSTVVWQYQEWYRCLTGPLQGRWYGYRDAWTIWEQICSLVHSQPRLPPDYRAYQPEHYRVYQTLQLATLAGVFVWCWRQRKRLAGDTARLLLVVFSMWSAWQLFIGPGTEQLTYGLIAPAAAWALLASFAEKKARWLTIAAWLLLTALPASDIEVAVRRVFPLGMILAPLGAALFIAWLVWHERKPRPCKTSPSPFGRRLG